MGRRTCIGVVVCVLAVGCGRLGYDSSGEVRRDGGDPPLDGARDARVDGMVDAPDGCQGEYEVVLGASDDTWIYVAQPLVNYGAASTFRSILSGPGLIRFDVTSLPPQRVLGAAVSLVCAGWAPEYGTVTHNVHVMRTPWREGAGNGTPAGAGEPSYDFRDTGAMIAWAGETRLDTPEDYDPTPLDSVTADYEEDRRYTWAIPPAVVEQWRADANINHGLLLATQAGEHLFLFSKDARDSTRRPELRVRLECP